MVVLPSLLYFYIWCQSSNTVYSIPYSYMYSVQFIASVEIKYSYFPCLIVLIKKHLAICSTKNVSIDAWFCWLLKITYTTPLMPNFRTIFMLPVLAVE